MAEVRLRAELEESKAELGMLRQRMPLDVPTVHEEISLISLIPKWSWAETSVSLEKFLSSIRRASAIGRWDESERLQVAILRLADPANTFYSTCLELHADDTTWQKFRSVFKKRFINYHTDQYHFLKLQTARQLKSEGPQEFADRCPWVGTEGHG